MPDMSRRGALLLLVAANVCWSASGWMIKVIELPGLALAGWRSAIAFLFLLAFRAGWRRGEAVPAPSAGPSPWRDRWLWLAGLAFALNTMCFVSATKLTTAANAILLQYTAPVYVLLAGAFWLREPVRRADLAALGGAFLGLALLLSERLGGGSAAGNALALASGLFFAVIIVVLRREAARDPLRVPLLGNLLAALLLAPWWLGAPVRGQWGLLLALGVGQYGLGYALYALGMRQVSAATGALAAAIEPVLNPVWVALLLHQTPGPRALAGGLLVLASVTARGWWATRNHR